MCRDEIKYFKKDSENFRIIHRQRNTQLQEGQSIIDNVYLRRLLWSNRLLLFTNCIMTYLLFDYILDNEALNRFLRVCVSNNTLVRNMLNDCQGTNIMNIDVYNPKDHTLSSCSFPLYFIDKCFGN